MSSPVPSSFRRRTRDGFIVVAVLWILTALATLASVYAIYVSNTVGAAAVNDDRIQADALISAALELSAYQLTSVKQQTRPTRGAFNFRMGRANVAVEFRSEAARIDLNAAPKELLAGFFAALGGRPSDVTYYADRVVGWRAPSNEESSPESNEASAYRTAGLNYAPRGAPFAHVGELSLVLGLPPQLVARAMPYVTIFSGRPEINVLDAAPLVLAALPGMTPERLNAVLSQRDANQQDGQFLLTLLGPARGSATIEGSKATRVTVRLDFDNGRRINAAAVILILEDGDEPFRILSWRDDADGPILDELPKTGLR